MQGRLGKGSFASVYKAVNKKTERVVAVKVLQKSRFASRPKLLPSIVQEVGILMSLEAHVSYKTLFTTQKNMDTQTLLHSLVLSRLRKCTTNQNIFIWFWNSKCDRWFFIPSPLELTDPQCSERWIFRLSLGSTAASRAWSPFCHVATFPCYPVFTRQGHRSPRSQAWEWYLLLHPYPVSECLTVCDLQFCWWTNKLFTLR